MGPRLRLRHVRRLAATIVAVPVVLLGSAAEAEGMVAPEPSALVTDLRPLATGVPLPTGVPLLSGVPLRSGAPLPRGAGVSLDPGARPEGPAVGWTWPLQPRPAVLARFDPPEVAWGSGHRGVDLATSVGQDVLAPVAGTVTFSGVVVDRGVVVVSTASELRATFEPVEGVVPGGTAVVAGQVVGRVTGGPGHCAPAVCLHWGVLRGETYLDPLALLGVRRVVLLPLAPP